MDSTTETVTKAVVNKNTVKIALDEYNELVQKAARPVVQNVIRKTMTDVQIAQQNVAWGTALMVIGTGMGAAGVLIRSLGKAKLK